MTDDVSSLSKLEPTWLSLIDFINSISQTDDIQDVSTRTVGGKVTLSAGGEGGLVRGRSRPTALNLAGYGSAIGWITTRAIVSKMTDNVSSGTLNPTVPLT